MKGKFLRRLRAGFTLAESLIAIAILALVSAAVVTVSTTVFSTKNTMIELGKCQTLASTAVSMIADEIRYGRNIREEDGTIVLDSMNFGVETRFTADSGSGRIVVKNGGANTEGKGSYELLPEKYYGSLTVSALKLEKVSADETELTNHAIKISITVSGSGKNLYSTEMTVPALNGIK